MLIGCSPGPSVSKTSDRLWERNQDLLWVRINPYQTANTVIYAENAWAAKQLAEAQYGVGMVLNYTQMD